jgi:anti-sigma factor RsiW
MEHVVVRHVTHLLTKYVHGQLRPALRAQVVNHVRTCADCRVALAEEERLAADLRREMPQIGRPQPGQLAKVWAGVWQEVSAPPRRTFTWNWLPGLSAMMVVLLLAAFVVPLLTQANVRAAAAPLPPQPQVMAFATTTPKITNEAPGITPTNDFEGFASPAPVPRETASPSFGG